VNVISPDATETPGINALAGILHPRHDVARELGNYQRDIVPSARHITAQKVADTALFLAAGLASLATGAGAVGGARPRLPPRLLPRPGPRPHPTSCKALLAFYLDHVGPVRSALDRFAASLR
jgi:hypothetical protein